MSRLRRLMFVCAVLFASRAQAQHVLVPMDDAQANHLKAYGVSFNALTGGVRAEWLINYRGGAFLLPDVPFVRRRAALDGVTFEALADAAVNAIRNEIADGNADAVPLGKAPRVALRGDSVHARLGRRGAGAGPRAVRLDSPLSRRLHGAAEQAVPELPRR